MAWSIPTQGIPISASRKVRRDRKPRAIRVCRECGAEFEVRQSQVDAGRGLFCSRKCAGRSSGRKSGNAKVSRKCNVCGDLYCARPDDLEAGRGLYCSNQCWHVERSARRQRRQDGKVFTCLMCGIVFTDKTRTNRERQFCSNKCRGQSLRKLVKAKNKRGFKDRKWARQVILRDKKCVRCGAIENLQAHHLKSWDRHREVRYDLANGVALCCYCHHAQHPTQPLEQFTNNGGSTVRYCVVCEGSYLVPKKDQRTCSISCGQKLRRAAGD